MEFLTIINIKTDLKKFLHEDTSSQRDPEVSKGPSFVHEVGEEV